MRWHAERINFKHGNVTFVVLRTAASPPFLEVKSLFRFPGCLSPSPTAARRHGGMCFVSCRPASENEIVGGQWLTSRPMTTAGAGLALAIVERARLAPGPIQAQLNKPDNPEPDVLLETLQTIIKSLLVSALSPTKPNGARRRNPHRILLPTFNSTALHT